MELEKMSSHEIISYVRKQTGKRITISPKSKKSIIKKARELLGEKIAKELLSKNHPKKSPDERILDRFSSKKQPTTTESYSKEKSKEIKGILQAMEICIKDLLKIL
jgi:hypothetical protein